MLRAFTVFMALVLCTTVHAYEISITSPVSGDCQNSGNEIFEGFIGKELDIDSSRRGTTIEVDLSEPTFIFFDDLHVRLHVAVHACGDSPCTEVTNNNGDSVLDPRGHPTFERVDPRNPTGPKIQVTPTYHAQSDFFGLGPDDLVGDDTQSELVNVPYDLITDGHVAITTVLESTCFDHIFGSGERATYLDDCVLKNCKDKTDGTIRESMTCDADKEEEDGFTIQDPISRASTIYLTIDRLPPVATFTGDQLLNLREEGDERPYDADLCNVEQAEFEPEYADSKDPTSVCVDENNIVKRTIRAYAPFNESCNANETEVANVAWNSGVKSSTWENVQDGCIKQRVLKLEDHCGNVTEYSWDQYTSPPQGAVISTTLEGRACKNEQCTSPGKCENTTTGAIRTIRPYAPFNETCETGETLTLIPNTTFGNNDQVVAAQIATTTVRPPNCAQPSPTVLMRAGDDGVFPTSCETAPDQCRALAVDEVIVEPGLYKAMSTIWVCGSSNDPSGNTSFGASDELIFEVMGSPQIKLAKAYKVAEGSSFTLTVNSDSVDDPTIGNMIVALPPGSAEALGSVVKYEWNLDTWDPSALSTNGGFNSRFVSTNDPNTPVDLSSFEGPVDLEAESFTFITKRSSDDKDDSYLAANPAQANQCPGPLCGYTCPGDKCPHYVVALRITTRNADGEEFVFEQPGDCRTACSTNQTALNTCIANCANNNLAADCPAYCLSDCQMTCDEDFKITVNDVNPTCDLGAPYTGVEKGATFSFDRTAVSAGNLADPLDRYVWDFGDGTPPREIDAQNADDSRCIADPTSCDRDGRNPEHQFKSAGTFQVKLTVFDEDSASTCTTSVTVVDVSPRILSLGLPSEQWTDNDFLEEEWLVEGRAIAFEAQTEPGSSVDPITEHVWNFGDGISQSTGTSPEATHTFSASGTYDVCLTVSDQDSNVHGCINVSIGELQPTAILTQPLNDANEIIQGQPATFDGKNSQAGGDRSLEPIVRFTWKFTNLDNPEAEPILLESAPQDNPRITHTFDQDGQYSVELTVWDEDGSTGITTTQFSVKDAIPIAKVRFQSGSEAVGWAEGDAVKLSGADSRPGAEADPLERYVWDYGDGTLETIFVSDGITAPSHVYANDGTYQVKLSVVDIDGSIGEDTMIVTVANKVPTVVLDRTEEKIELGQELGFVMVHKDDTTEFTEPMVIARVDDVLADFPATQATWTIDGQPFDPTQPVTFDTIGDKVIRCTVNDGQADSTEESITVTVTSATLWFENIGLQQGVEGESLQFSLKVFTPVVGPDTPGEIAFDILEQPVGANITTVVEADGLRINFEWTPDYDDAGSHRLWLRAGQGDTERLRDIPIQIADKEPPIVELVLIESSIRLTPNESQTLSVVGINSEGEEILDLPIEWSLDPNVALDLDEKTGVVTAQCDVGNYQSAVTASFGPLSISASVEVIAGSPKPWRMSAVSLPETMPAGGSVLLDGVVLDACGAIINVNVEWSAKESLGTIDSSRMFTAGCTQGAFVDGIQARFGDQIEQFDVSVSEGTPIKLEMGLGPFELTVESSNRFEVHTVDSCGVVRPVEADWSVNRSSLTMSSNKGSETLVSTGCALVADGVLTAVYEGLEVRTDVIVTPGAVETLTLESEANSVRAGESVMLSALAVDRCGHPLAVDVQWSLGDPSGQGLERASTVTDGVFYAACGDEGRVDVRVNTLDDLHEATASIEVLINEQTVFDVTPNLVEVVAGSTTEFTAEWGSVCGTLQVADVAWSTNSPGSIDQSGVFTAPEVAGIYPKAVIATRMGLETAIDLVVIPAEPAAIRSNPGEERIGTSGQHQFGVTVVDQFRNRIENPDLAWRVEGQQFSIDGEGRFDLDCALAPGVYDDILVVSSGALSKAFDIVVLAGKTAFLAAVPNYVEVEALEQVQFSATQQDVCGYPTDENVSWSADEGGQISPSGLYTAGGRAGMYSVAGTLGELSGRAEVSIKPSFPERLTILHKPLTVSAGAQLELAAEAEDRFGNRWRPESVDWTVSEEIGTVGPRGLFSAGTVAGVFPNGIMAEYLSVYDRAEMMITPAQANRVRLMPLTPTVVAGTSIRFTSSVTDEYGNEIPDANVTYSAHPDVGIIGEDGLFTASIRLGTFESAITASYGEISEATDVTITFGAPASVTIVPNDVRLPMGGMLQFQASVMDAQGLTVENVAVEWAADPELGTISGDGVLSVSNISGAFEDGVRASIGGVSSSVQVTIPSDFDEDGVDDARELQYGFSPVDSSDMAADTDDDGLLNGDEIEAGLSPRDQDSDDDGIADGREPDWSLDSDGDGQINALDADSDNDGILDGTELGVVMPTADTNVENGNFRKDVDPEHTTDPLETDTDGDGESDGAEDRNADGAQSAGETAAHSDSPLIACLENTAVSDCPDDFECAVTSGEALGTCVEVEPESPVHPDHGNAEPMDQGVMEADGDVSNAANSGSEVPPNRGGGGCTMNPNAGGSMWGLFVLALLARFRRS